jgi:hypothetical protein
MRKGEVSIAEMSIKVSVIAFALKIFRKDDLEEIKEYISANPFADDLAMNNGQIVIDEMQNILYTGSASAAMYIAMAYKKKSLSKKYGIIVYRKTIAEESVPMIMAMVASENPGRRKPKVKPEPKHNLQPVVDEMKKIKIKRKKK